MTDQECAALANFSSLFLRLALGTGSSIRGGGPVRALGRLRAAQCVVGKYSRFVAYTARLNWYLPVGMMRAVALIATVAEIIFSLLLILGWKTRIAALLSGVLMSFFALAMTMALGGKAPKSSVFPAAGGALLLSNMRKLSVQHG